MFTHARLGHWVPLTWLTHGLDYVLWGMDPHGYHLANVAFHALDGLLLYLLLTRLGIGAPLLAALFFALHPLRVESVAWVTARRDLVCGLFVMLCLHAYLSAARSDGRARWTQLLAANLLFACALMSKGTAMALPVGLLALDLTVLGRLPWGWPRGAGRVLVEKVPFLLLSIASLVVSLYAASDVRSPLAKIGLAPRLAAVAFSLAFYIGKTVWPARLAVLVPWDPYAKLTHMPYLGCAIGATLLAVLAIAGSTVGPVSIRAQARSVLAAIAVYAAFVLPVSGLWQAGPQLTASRYSYLACLPWAVLFGACIARLGRCALVAGIPLLAVLASLAWRETYVWRDGLSLWAAAAREAPGASLPRYGLAYVYMNKGQWKEYAQQVDVGLSNNPSASDLLNLSALLKSSCPDPRFRDGTMAVAQARRAVELSSDLYLRATLGAALAETGDFAQARAVVETALAEGKKRDAPELVAHLEHLLTLFRAGRPYRMADPSAPKAGP